MDIIIRLIDCVKKNSSLLTFEELDIEKISQSDISGLIQMRILEKSQDKYHFNLNNLVEHLISLEKLKKYDEALIGLIKCREIVSSDNIDLHIFKLYLLKKEFDKAFNYFPLKLEKKSKDYNYLIISLLDNIISLPLEYKEIILKNEVSYLKPFGKVINLCKNAKYREAQKQLKYLEEKKDDNLESLDLEIPFILINRNNELNSQNKKFILKLLINEQYEELCFFLENLFSKHVNNYNCFEKIYTVTKLYLKLKNGEIITYPELATINRINSYVSINNYKKLFNYLNIPNDFNQQNEMVNLINKIYQLSFDNKFELEEFGVHASRIINNIKTRDDFKILTKLDNNSNMILQLAMDDPDIVVERIEDNGLMFILLRNIKYEYKESYENIFNEIDSLYKDGEFSEARKLCFKLIGYPEIDPQIFVKLGFIEFKSLHKSSSDRYFMVASLLSKKPNEQLDYFKHVDKKRFLKDKDAFEKEAIFYEIMNIYNILDFYFNHNVNLEIACLQFGLNVYQINIVKLLIAKQYYWAKDYAMGDLYYQSVLNSEYQNASIKFLIENFGDKKKLKNGNLHKAISITSKLSRRKS